MGRGFIETAVEDQSAPKPQSNLQYNQANSPRFPNLQLDKATKKQEFSKTSIKQILTPNKLSKLSKSVNQTKLHQNSGIKALQNLHQTHIITKQTLKTVQILNQTKRQQNTEIKAL